MNLFDQTNFGWSTREGMHNYDPSDDCTSPPSPLDNNNLTDPVAGTTLWRKLLNNWWVTGWIKAPNYC